MACPIVLVTVPRIPPPSAALVVEAGLTTDEVEELAAGEEAAPEAIRSPMLPADLKKTVSIKFKFGKARGVY